MAAADFTRERTRIVNDTTAEIGRILQQAAARIVAIMANQPTDYQRWYLPQLMAEIERVLRENGADAGRLAADAQDATAAAGTGLIDGALAAAQIRVLVPRIASTQLLAMKSFLTEKIRGVTLAAANDINTRLGLVTLGTLSPFEAIKAVQSILGESTRQRATTIVHTELARGFSTASYERLAQAADLVPGLQKRWRKSGKLHPRVEHAAINNQVQDWNKPFVLHGGRVTMMYPHDPAAPAAETINCGCIMLPVVPGFRAMVAA